MAPPLESTPAGRRILRRFAGLALLLLITAMQSGGSLAEDQSTSFSATVKGGSTADSAAAARDRNAGWAAAGQPRKYGIGGGLQCPCRWSPHPPDAGFFAVAPAWHCCCSSLRCRAEFRSRRIKAPAFRRPSRSIPPLIALLLR